ncbi:terminase large subunit domain-containing protein [Nesterenkonia aerolata]|uniref:Terminase large subunit n=1 Tax=Nesterenkonia aerolata TaxID=3074079 RepID=A0ABU2DNX3_9MICC|nr:terminase large subunit [Nesterenkonia sp. LY-0111]MDR8018199.1 terminase large subunit [Nesterenkonia sp. LY-0111]
MKAGPKSRVDDSALPFRPRVSGAARFAKFCEKFVNVPKGKGAGHRLRLRPWQVDLVASVLDAEPWPTTAGWMLPRGQGKSSLVAALGLYDLLLGQEGASVVVAAVDERQAKIVFNAASRMVELEEELATRVQVYKDRLVVPARGASFQVLPASPKALEGLDPTLAIVDEVGVVNRDVWEVIALAQGKREQSTMIGIGTPGPDPHDSVLTDLRDYHRAHPEDTTLVFREFSAAGFTDHPVDCEHCWELANPALGDFLNRETIRALLPPKTRESTFRRARLCQFVTETSGAFLPEGRWEELNTGEEIGPGEDVILALDGSFNSDSTAVLVARVAMEPHFDVVGLWEPGGDESYRVPVEEVEDTIRAACRQWNVLEVTADPFRWTRSLQLLEREGIIVSEFPWSHARITPATTDFYNACVNGAVSHSGDERLARHIGNAVVNESDRGVRLDKSRRGSTKHIDLAAAAVMGHSRAQWRAMKKNKKRRARSFKR